LLAFFAQTEALLNGDSHREKVQLQLAILSLEALQAARQIRIAGCSEEERAKLGALIRALQALITPVSQVAFSPRQIAGNDKTDTEAAV
jgi:hypothetical protein